MERSSSRKHLAVVLIFLALVLFPLASCISSSASAYLDAGASNLTATGAQFAQNWLIRFDTSSTQRTLFTPSAADIVKNLQSPSVGEVVIIAVTADGANTVTIQGGTGVIVKPSASTIAADTTLTLYCVLTSVISGSEGVTIY